MNDKLFLELVESMRQAGKTHRAMRRHHKARSIASARRLAERWSQPIDRWPNETARTAWVERTARLLANTRHQCSATIHGCGHKRAFLGRTIQELRADERDD
ncbi:MAG TPA: hypothetical protein VEU30_04555 [Thermoanaerobaculia bacterium]|nr:hypothetical protein [Thermoanaerobaculia bacterium]